MEDSIALGEIITFDNNCIVIGYSNGMVPVPGQCCFVCSENIDDKPRIIAQNCRHKICIGCMPASVINFHIPFTENVARLSSYKYSDNIKGECSIPGLCPVCYVQNAMKSKNFVKN